MEANDLIMDVCLMVLGVAGAVFVVKKRRYFDLWASLMVCTACILKGIRLLCYDCFVMALKTQEITTDIFFIQKVSFALNCIDVMIGLLLIAALVRLFCQHMVEKSKTEKT